MLSFLLAILLGGAPAMELTATGYERGEAVPVQLRRIPGTSLDGRPLYLDSDAAEAFDDLTEYALRCGIQLRVTYAFRDMEQQKRLHRKMPRLAAEPGHSNHQLGLSVDIDGTRVGRSTKRTRLYRWLKREAPRFGYVNDEASEPWHWTFQRRSTTVAENP